MEAAGLVVRSRRRRALGSKPDSTEDTPCKWACCTQKPISCVKGPRAGAAQKLAEGASLHLSSPSPDVSSPERGHPVLIKLNYNVSVHSE
ncbi:hypothetical protein AVEN_192106-1 [Araneus ventricosus]|uniref:Uncharacterized protein n=1 Tax=Araneus ventricosus TaxID=182803 RepID=A0A4Y2B961_ARAVE|nr:hypothetical protein AVEN_192106-1 [Araneus ventricosus]